MPNYFEEKATQIEPSALKAFGIQLSSRYGKANEMVQMLNFARRATELGVGEVVREVFYDTKACVCSFKLSPFVREGDPTATKLQAAAEETIQQYELFGFILHGAGCQD